MSKSLLLKPRISEKTYGLSEKLNTYVFEVPKAASKQLVAAAVAAQYEVSVVRVRIATSAGKTRKTYRNSGRSSISGERAGLRKAYVTLREGDKLPIFAAVEDSAEAKPANAKEKK